jgi:glucose/arabinose dehydrogenase
MPFVSAARSAAFVVTVAAALPANAQDTFSVTGTSGTPLVGEATASLDSPWAMTLLPDGRMLVTEKAGALVLISADGRPLGTVEGVPDTAVVGQGGLGDVVLHPEFEQNGLVYVSYIEPGDSGYGGVVVRGRLELTEAGGRLTDVERIWTQRPKMSGGRHFSLKMAFGPDGYLYITTGDRGRQTPAQNMDVNLGKIVRLNADGSIPADNPFADRGGIQAEFWTIGHRNPLGIDFAPDGDLWSNEMGPRGGDELNLIRRGENYGWPVVSEGVNYSMVPIPDHDTRPRFEPPVVAWVPSISPAGLTIYDGKVFPEWQGDAIMGALSGRALVVAELANDAFQSEERFEWGARVRDVEVGADGAIWVIEDGDGGRLIRFTPE